MTSLECPNCHVVEEVLRPVSEITFEAGHCPDCGELRDAQFSHMITGEENFLHRTLANVGVPPLHILRAHNGFEYRFYELSGDLSEALHFRHFEQTEPEKPLKIGGRIRLKEEVRLVDAPTNPAPARIRLLDEKPKEKVIIKSTKKRINVIDQPDMVKVGKAASNRVQDAEGERSKQISSEPSHKQVKVH